MSMTYKQNTCGKKKRWKVKHMYLPRDGGQAKVTKVVIRRIDKLNFPF